MENLYVFAVVPHAGTWIEIKSIAGTIQNAGSRSPRGNVD